MTLTTVPLLSTIKTTMQQCQLQQPQQQHQHRQHGNKKHYSQNMEEKRIYTKSTTTTLSLNTNANNKNNSNNKKFLLILFLSISLSFVLLLQLLSSNSSTIFTTAAGWGTNPRVTQKLPNKTPGECTSIDIRNFCDSVYQLTNCTMVRGFVIFFLRPVHVDACDYTNVTFPLLREITDFLIMHDVRGLRTLKDLFPNLTVIRGRRLFLNYALGITNSPDLETVEFKSLLAIQHGHVYINCPKVCNLDKINWDRLTLSPGENHIFPPSREECPYKTVCPDCSTRFCWTNETCQLFEHTNLITPSNGALPCHEECLGGCYNTTSRGCLLCRHLTDHGSCVKECPEGKYLIEAYQNCTTKAECLAANMTIEGKNCTLECQYGEMVAYNEDEHLSCVPCDTPYRHDLINIESLSDANRIRGCRILNASVEISIRYKVNENDLSMMFAELSEIRGSLRIYRSDGLTSLRFLSNLHKIGTNPAFLDAGAYALTLYDNENLVDLWNPPQLEIYFGSIYIHLNKKLCNRKLREFMRRVDHDRSMDTIQVNDQEVMCDPIKLPISIQVLSHRTVTFSWAKIQTSNEVEILYRPVGHDEYFGDKSELDSDICHRIQWTRILLSPKELASNASSYSYTVNDMKPHTHYACIIKTFGLSSEYDGQSALTYIQTLLEYPGPPTINVTRKTDISITISLKNPPNDFVQYFSLELYEIPDNITMLERRDFCSQPGYTYRMNDYIHDNANDNKDDEVNSCCTRKEEEEDDERFRKNILQLFKCTDDQREYCYPFGSNKMVKPLKVTLRLQITAYENNLSDLTFLKPYRLYAIQVQSCNMAGCGSFAFHSLRTEPAPTNSQLEDFTACRASATKEFHVYFKEPKQTNSPIVSYVIHFKLTNRQNSQVTSYNECLTRLQHQYNNYNFVAQLKAPYNQIAVRVNMISGSYLSYWMPINFCPSDKPVEKTKVEKKSEPKVSDGVLIASFSVVIAITCFAIWYCVKSGYLYVNATRMTPLLGWEAIRRDEIEELVVFHNVPPEDAIHEASRV